MKRYIITIGILVIGCNTAGVESANKTSGQPTHQETGRAPVNKDIQTGDLIFHTSRSDQSRAIQIATNSRYSHMGIIFQEGDEYFVYEAVQPVKLTRLSDWIARGENGKYVVKRLKNSDAVLTEAGIAKMKSTGRKYLGKAYDLKFEWSDDKMYCSELVWKIYKETFNIEIGKPERMGNFDLSDETVRKKARERYGDHIPEDEPVITPDAMFRAENLITITEH